MLRENFVPIKRSEPFVPFRVTLANGKQYECVHPQLMMVGPRDLMIGFPRKGSSEPFFERHVWLPYSDIDKVEFLDESWLLIPQEPRFER